MSQKDVAKIVSSQQQVVSKWETGLSEPDFKSLVLLCDFFDVSADFLLGLDSPFAAKKSNSFSLSPIQLDLLNAFNKLSLQDQYKALGVILGFVAY